MEWRMPRYMIREEVKRGKMRENMGRRAVMFEEKLRSGGGNIIARLCWKEVLDRENEKGSKWEEDRKGSMKVGATLR